MQVHKTNIHEDHSRDTFWTRVHLDSDDSQEHSVVLACVSHEYLWDQLKKNRFNIGEVERDWLDPLIQRYVKEGDVIFKDPVHYHVDAMTDEGTKNGYDFLKGVTP